MDMTKEQSNQVPYMTVSEQNRISILNLQSEILTIHAKIDKILEWIAKK
jgi:hypothetical protein